MKPKARKNYLSCDDIFMMIAKVIAQRSKDPSTQTGAVVVDKNNNLAGMGYNDLPRGVKDNLFPWGKDYGENKQNIHNTKYPYIVHAEINAILNAGRPIEEGTMYCLLFPCSECAKIIIQSGIKKLIYEDDRYELNRNNFSISKKLFDVAGIKYKKYIFKKNL